MVGVHVLSFVGCRERGGWEEGGGWMDGGWMKSGTYVVTVKAVSLISNSVLGSEPGKGEYLQC